jgi:PAS domain S-box-containing protein
MLTPDFPENEAERLTELESYEILDSASEASFDALTRLAAYILQVPITLVSLVDKDRQWFKSRQGLDVTETHRDISFCGHVVASAEFMVVPNASEDPRFHDNPLVTGEPRIRFYVGVPLKTSQGHILGTLCAIDNVPRQITDEQVELLGMLAAQVMALLELRRAAKRLAEKQHVIARGEAELRAIFAAMNEGVVKQVKSGAIIACNPAAEKILGLSRDQMMGLKSVDPNWRSIRDDGNDFPGDEHPAMVALTTSKPQRDVVMGVHKPGGELTWININAEPILTDGVAESVVTTFRDITEERTRLAEQDLLRSQAASRQRLATAGTLAAGVAHEVNTPLTYIISNTDFILDSYAESPPENPDIVSALQDVRQGADIISEVVNGLRIFAREEVCIRATSAHQVIKIAVNISAYQMKQTTKWEIIESKCPLVVADDSLLAQVLVNLLVNAAGSFAESCEENLITISTEVAGDKVIISVHDNGSGIAPEVLPNVFDPFFTTKQVGSGVGLGLSVAKGIMTSLGGELTCESALGVGSTFCVILRAATPESLAAGSF